MLTFVKYVLFTIAVLVLSQIPINGVRICDHVERILPMHAFQGFTKKISKSIDFKDQFSSTGRGKPENRPAQDSVDHEEKAILSGLLKPVHQ